jgi:hypothetical protein
MIECIFYIHFILCAAIFNLSSFNSAGKCWKVSKLWALSQINSAFSWGCFWKGWSQLSWWSFITRRSVLPHEWRGCWQKVISCLGLPVHGQEKSETWVTCTTVPWGPVDLRLPDVTHSEKASSRKAGQPPVLPVMGSKAPFPSRFHN